jgi:hypothetical protein
MFTMSQLCRLTLQPSVIGFNAVGLACMSSTSLPLLLGLILKLPLSNNAAGSRQQPADAA